MIGTVIQGCPEVYYWVSGQDPLNHCLHDSLLNCRYILPRDSAANNLVHKLKPGASRKGTEFKPCVAILSFSA